MTEAETAAGKRPSPLERRLNRAIAARKEAERLLEAKSLELFKSNQALEAQAESARQTALRLKTIMDAVADGIFAIDGGGLIETVNPAACRIFASDQVTLIGTAFRTLLPADQGAEFMAWVAQQGDCERGRDGHGGAPASASPYREFVGLRADGTRFPMEVAATGVKDGDTQRTILIARDVSLRHKMEAEREKMQKELAQVAKLEAVGQLANGIAHEINTPIQFIGDNLSFLKDAFGEMNGLLGDPGDDGAVTIGPEASEAADLPYLLSEVPSAIDQSLEGVAQVASIVQAMKSFSHPGSREPEPVDINKAIETTMTVCRNEWKYIADIETRLDQSLPSVQGFPGEINQVLLNLIVNAAHAIQDSDKPGKGKITIESRESAKPDRVEVIIRDSGGGIPEAIRDRIFDPFFTTKDVGRGSGQGLAIVREVIVNKHGGSIRFDTTAGDGTTFILELPCFDQDRPGAAGA